MERINAKEVQSMMEAYASIYKTEEQETLSEGYGKDCVKKEKKTKHNCAKKVCSEQWGEGTCVPEHHTLLEDGTVTHYDVVFKHGLERMVPVEELEVLVTEMHEHASMEGEVLEEDPIKYLGDKFKKGADQIGGFFNRLNQPRTGLNPNRAFSSRGAGRAAFRDANIPADSGIKQSGGGLNQGEKPGTSAEKPKTSVEKPRPQSPSSNLKPGSPNETKDGTKFERRLPTSAELRAAQQARKDAPKVLSRSEIENRAIKAGVGVAKGTVKDPKIAADAARKAELERIRSRASSQTQAGVRPTVSSTADPKTPPAVPAAKPAAAAPAPVVKKKPAMGARNRMRMEELDVFDTIKEYLIGEGATEEEALKQMLTLTDEQRTEILEGSCGSKKKKKSKKGGY